MMINTLEEASEYFEHNPKDKKLYFIMLTEADIDRFEIETEYDVDVLHTEENK